MLHSDVTHPAGNMYTIRHYAVCTRYLRYSIYTMLAGDFFILDELVLNALKKTYNSFIISIASTIQAMREVTAALISIYAGKEISVFSLHLL